MPRPEHLGVLRPRAGEAATTGAQDAERPPDDGGEVGTPPEGGVDRTPEYSRRAGMKILNISAFFFCDVSFKLVIFRYF